MAGARIGQITAGDVTAWWLRGGWMVEGLRVHVALLRSALVISGGDLSAVVSDWQKCAPVVSSCKTCSPYL